MEQMERLIRERDEARAAGLRAVELAALWMHPDIYPSFAAEIASLRKALFPTRIAPSSPSRTDP